MKCEEVQRLLGSGEVSPSESQQMEEHLATCDLCRQRRRELEAVTANLQALRSNPNSEGRLVRAAIAQFQAEQSAKAQSRSPHFWGWGMALGATAAASVGLTLYLSRDMGKVGPSGEVPTIASAKHPTPAATPVTPPASRIASSHPVRKQEIDTQPQGVEVAPQQTPSRETPLPQYIVRTPASPEPKRQPVRVANVPAPVAPVVDDLDYINTGTTLFANRWTTLSQSEEQKAITEILRSVKREDDFVEVPPPLVAANRNAAVTRSALAQYRHELQIVDARLQRKVTLGEKGIPFGDLCKKLEMLTSISFTAGRNVMEDKVTIFCKERPLRDIMREIAMLFNFTWERNGEEGDFSYRLKQPLAAALLEEELRNKDQNEALLALDREMAAIRNLMNLSPEEARQRALNTEGPEHQRLQTVAGIGRAPAQLYGQLSPEDMTALRDGNYLNFSSQPDAGGRSISPEMSASILQSFPTARVLPHGGLTSNAQGDDLKNGIPLTQAPGMNSQAALWISRSELGQFQLMGVSGFGTNTSIITMSASLAEGISPSSRTPKNAEANAPLRGTPEMQKKVSIVVEPSCEVNRYSYPAISQPTVAEFIDTSSRITTADALETIHKVTGQDVIGDYYTRVYYPSDATVQGVTLFDALCNIADNLRLRWNQAGGWLGFRSASFFYDRQKEVPKRLLERWAAARKRTGYLTIKEFIEIAKLNKVQLNSGLLAEGIQAIYGINEWEFMRSSYQRHLRFLASLPPTAQQAALSKEGLPFSRLTYAEQQSFAQIMETLPFTPEVMPGITFRARITIPQPKKPETTSTDEKANKNEGWLAMRFTYIWQEGDTRMGFYQDYQGTGMGGADALVGLREESPNPR